MENPTSEVLLQIRFTSDFTAVQVEGELEDPSSFGVTLMTALRSVSGGSEALSLGELKSMRGFDGEHGFQLHLDESGHNLKKFAGIFQWSDFDASAPPARQYPVLPTGHDYSSWIDSLPGVRWRGLRTQSDDEWTHFFGDPGLNEEIVSSFGLSILQLDLLVRSLNLPRRQLQLVFGQQTLWTAVNQDSDFLLALTDAALTPGGQTTLERCLSFFTWPI